MDVEPAHGIRAGQTRCVEGLMPKEDTFEEDVGAKHKGVVEHDFREGHGFPSIALAQWTYKAPVTLAHRPRHIRIFSTEISLSELQRESN